MNTKNKGDRLAIKNNRSLHPTWDNNRRHTTLKPGTKCGRNDKTPADWIIQAEQALGARQGHLGGQPEHWASRSY